MVSELSWVNSEKKPAEELRGGKWANKNNLRKKFVSFCKRLSIN